MANIPFLSVPEVVNFSFSPGLFTDEVLFCSSEQRKIVMA
jgi:hypothetical protein